jgi:hypothetical protein
VEANQFEAQKEAFLDALQDRHVVDHATNVRSIG